MTKVSSQDDAVYVSTSRGTLYRWDPVTGQTERIGATGHVFTDLAIAPDGQLYGITFTGLYTIDAADGSARFVGPLPARDPIFPG